MSHCIYCMALSTHRIIVFRIVLVDALFLYSIRVRAHQYHNERIHKENIPSHQALIKLDMQGQPCVTEGAQPTCFN